MFWHETSARLREAIEVLFVAGPLSLFIGELLAAARARCLGHARRRAPLPGRLTVAASRCLRTHLDGVPDGQGQNAVVAPRPERLL